MYLKFLRILGCVLFIVCVLSTSPRVQPQVGQVPSVIFDSDMGPDYDDVGAIALLHALADRKQVKILAMAASTNYEGVAAVFDVFNTYFKKPDILIGVPKGAAVDQKDWQHWTDTVLLRYPHSIQKNAEAPDAVEVYRKVLAAAPDKSVTIITVGFVTNLAGLLQSKPDAYSSLAGPDLISKKVKQLVCMAGWFPKGKEFNVHKDAAASRIVFEQWNTPVIFSGFEIGVKIKTGLPLIANEKISNSPVKDVFRLCIPMDKQDVDGRSSWDETAVLVAVKGANPYFGLQPGRIVVAEDGSNTWDIRGKGHNFLTENLPPTVAQKVINDMMMHQPR